MNIWEVEDEVEAETLKEQELSQSGEGASRDPSKAKSSSGRRAFPAPNTLRDGYLGRYPTGNYMCVDWERSLLVHHPALSVTCGHLPNSSNNIIPSLCCVALQVLLRWTVTPPRRALESDICWGTCGSGSRAALQIR